MHFVVGLFLNEDILLKEWWTELISSRYFQIILVVLGLKSAIKILKRIILV